MNQRQHQKQGQYHEQNQVQHRNILNSMGCDLIVISLVLMPVEKCLSNLWVVFHRPLFPYSDSSTLDMALSICLLLVAL